MAKEGKSGDILMKYPISHGEDPNAFSGAADCMGVPSWNRPEVCWRGAGIAPVLADGILKV